MKILLEIAFVESTGFGLNSILYQRGVYPDDMFERKDAYGLSILVTKDPKLEQFLKTVLDQVRGLNVY